MVTGNNPGQGPIINGIQFPAQNNYFFTPTGTNSGQASSTAQGQVQANYGTQQNPITWYVYQDPQGKYSFADVTHQIPGTHAITELPGFGYGQVTINGKLVDFQTAAQTVHTWSPEYQVELVQNYVNSQPSQPAQPQSYYASSGGASANTSAAGSYGQSNPPGNSSLTSGFGVGSPTQSTSAPTLNNYGNVVTSSNGNNQGYGSSGGANSNASGGNALSVYGRVVGSNPAGGSGFNAASPSGIYTPATQHYLDVVARTQNTGPISDGQYKQNNLDLYNAELAMKAENAAMQGQYQDLWRDQITTQARNILAKNTGTVNQNNFESQWAVSVLAGDNYAMQNGGQYGFAPGNQAEQTLYDLQATGVVVSPTMWTAARSNDAAWNASGDPYSTRGINPITYNSMGIAGGTYTGNTSETAHGASAFNDDGTFNLNAWGNYYEPGNIYDVRTQLNRMAEDEKRRLESLNNKNPLGTFIGGGPTIVSVIPGYVAPPSPVQTPSPTPDPGYSPGGQNDPNNPGWLPDLSGAPGFKDEWKWDPAEGWVPITRDPNESVPGGMNDQDIRDSLFRGMIDSQANQLRSQGKYAEADALLKRTAGTNWNTGGLGQSGGAGDILNNLINMWGDAQYGNNLF